MTAAMRKRLAIQIKPIEWHETANFCSAVTPLGIIEIKRRPQDGMWPPDVKWIWGFRDGWHGAPTKAECKDRATSHFNSLVRACLQ